MGQLVQWRLVASFVVAASVPHGIPITGKLSTCIGSDRPFYMRQILQGFTSWPLTVPRKYCVSDSLRLLLKNRPSPLLSYPSSPYLPLRIPLIMPAFPLFSSCFSRSRDSLTMPDYYRTTRVEDYGPYLRTAQSSPDLYVCLFLYLKFVVLMPNFPDSLRC